MPLRAYGVSRMLDFGAPNVRRSSSGQAITTQTAYFVFLRTVLRSYIANTVWIRLHAGSAGLSVSASEMGLFWTTNPPNGAAQTLNKIAAASCTNSDWQAAGPADVKQAGGALGALIWQGCNLWAGFRVVTASTMPTPGAVGNPMTGEFLSLASAGALTGSATFSGSLVAGSIQQIAMWDSHS